MIGMGAPTRGIGPQPIDEELPQGPDENEMAMQFAAQQHAEDMAVKQAIEQLLQQQVQHTLQQGGEAGASVIGTALKPAVNNYLTSGAATTLSSSAVNAGKPAVEAGLGSTFGSAIGAGATIYGSYEGIKSGLGSARDVNNAITAGRMSPEEAADLRQKNFNRNMANTGIGAIGGALGGSGYGPIGTVAGALLGGAGGALGASRTYKDSDHPARDTAHALGRFMRKPWGR